MMYDTVENLVADFKDSRDYEDFNGRLIRTFGVASPVGENEALSMKEEQLTETVFKAVYEAYKQKSEAIMRAAYPVIESVHERQGDRFENIAIPITDGRKTLNVVANIKKCLESNGKEIISAIQKGLCLAVIDDAWKEHLREMDDLKQSVQNATYEQKDPLLIYKFEAFNLFKQLMVDINRDVSAFLCLGHLPMASQTQMEEARVQQTDMSRMRISRPDSAGDEGRAPVQTNQTQERAKPQPVHVEKKVGRNDPCPCGSGKKYKNCHGKDE